MNKILKYTMIVFIFININLFAQQEITIGVKPAPPFVTINDLAPSGFSIDIIEEVIRRIDPEWKIIYKIDKDLPSHLHNIETGGADIGIAATTVTFEREKKMDFSQPFYYSGLSIMIQATDQTTWDIIFSEEVYQFCIYMAIYILICASLIWFLERKNQTFSSRWEMGILESIWWTVVTISTVGYGDFSPKSKLGRGFGVFVIFSGIFLFGLVIASFSSSLTVNKIQNNINSVKDVIYYPVAVVKGTTGEKYMSKIHPDLISYNNLELAIQALREQKVKAIVHDAPLLKHAIKNNPDEHLILAGGVFSPSAYAICFPMDSELRKEVNIKLLEIMEDELYSKFIKKWFEGK